MARSLVSPSSEVSRKVLGSRADRPRGGTDEAASRRILLDTEGGLDPRREGVFGRCSYGSATSFHQVWMRAGLRRGGQPPNWRRSVWVGPFHDGASRR